MPRPTSADLHDLVERVRAIDLDAGRRLLRNAKRYSNSLEACFAWSESPEGFDYWHRINEALEDEALKDEALREESRSSSHGDETPAGDATNPDHYRSHPSGVECIQVTEHMDFLKGNAMKYLWRAGGKGDEIEDLKKAAWYIERRIALLEKGRGTE